MSVGVKISSNIPPSFYSACMCNITRPLHIGIHRNDKNYIQVSYKSIKWEQSRWHALLLILFIIGNIRTTPCGSL